MVPCRTALYHTVPHGIAPYRTVPQDDAKLYKNAEISNLIVGLGLGLKGDDLAGLRYGKVGGLGAPFFFGRTI